MYLENFISGYYQKSVILMSKLPLVTFFPQVTSVIARKFFEFGDVSIETAAKDIDSWTLPSPGHSVELPLMGHLFQLTIPSLSTRSGMYLHFRFRKKRSFSVKLHNFFNLSRIFSPLFQWNLDANWSTWHQAMEISYQLLIPLTFFYVCYLWSNTSILFGNLYWLLSHLW